MGIAVSDFALLPEVREARNWLLLCEGHIGQSVKGQQDARGQLSKDMLYFGTGVTFWTKNNYSKNESISPERPLLGFISLKMLLRGLWR